MQQSAHILVVEDDADIRRMIAEFLRRNGYRVQTAREGGELDRILEVSRIDLLILDIGLPQEDGLSVCRRIRTQSSVPIIMLTARGSELERVTGLESGADDYLSKPFGTHELLARIRALLRRARSVAEQALGLFVPHWSVVVEEVTAHFPPEQTATGHRRTVGRHRQKIPRRGPIAVGRLTAL